MLDSFCGNMIRITRKVYAGEVVNGQLNPLYLAITTSGYRIQSRTLQIPDIFTRSSPSSGTRGYTFNKHGRRHLSQYHYKCLPSLCSQTTRATQSLDVRNRTNARNGSRGRDDLGYIHNQPLS